MYELRRLEALKSSDLGERYFNAEECSLQSDLSRSTGALRGESKSSS